jgi:hypothetical protein
MRVYDHKLASGDEAAADIVKDVSPNAWQYVHLIGAFDFASRRLSPKSTSRRSRRL